MAYNIVDERWLSRSYQLHTVVVSVRVTVKLVRLHSGDYGPQACSLHWPWPIMSLTTTNRFRIFWKKRRRPDLTSIMLNLVLIGFNLVITLWQKDFNFNSFVSTLISTINNNCLLTMDSDYLNYVTSTKLKKVNDKNVMPLSHLILKISFLTLFGCVVKVTLDINPIHIWLDG